MIEAKKLINLLINNNINFFSGVPDSCTNEFCNELSKQKGIVNIIAPNEGLAVSLGVGNYLATKKIPCIYLQNSGLGNATDPLTNLISKDVYDIPCILLIGWRGVPGLNDEPQHKIQGKAILKILKLYGIDYIILNNDIDLVKVKNLLSSIKKKSNRIAIVVKPNVFFKSKIKIKYSKKNNLIRYEFFKVFLKKIKKNTQIFSSVGFNSREIYQIRREEKILFGKDFLVVGGMGHTLPIALSYSNKRKNDVICVDGDGSFLMHLGSLALLEKFKCKNFKYVLIDNNSHESIGDQKINLKKINYKKIALAFNFKNYFFLNKRKNLLSIITKFIKYKGPSFLHVKVNTGTLDNLMRPKNFNNMKKLFMND